MVKILLLNVIMIALPAYAFDELTVRDGQECRNAFGPKAKFPWTDFATKDLKIETLLPKAYLDKLRRFSKVSITLNSLGKRKGPKQPNTEYIRLEINGGVYTIFSLIFGRDPTDPSVLYVEDLFAQDILQDRNRTGRPRIQEAPGLPNEVFTLITSNLLQWAKSHGIKQIRTTGADNYLVMMLYRRHFGFTPAHEKARQVIADIDGLYEDILTPYGNSLAGNRREFNRQLYAHMLGLQDSETSQELVDLWQSHLRGERSSATRVLTGRSGAKFFLGYLSNNLVSVSLIDESISPPRLLRWKNLLEADLVSLQLSL